MRNKYKPRPEQVYWVVLNRYPELQGKPLRQLYPIYYKLMAKARKEVINYANNSAGT